MKLLKLFSIIFCVFLYTSCGQMGVKAKDNYISDYEVFVKEVRVLHENFTEEELNFALEIIHNINDEGYLELEIDSLISKTKLDKDDCLEILSMIRHMEPAGCGARTIQECLLSQAECLTPRLDLVELII